VEMTMVFLPPDNRRSCGCKNS